MTITDTHTHLYSEEFDQDRDEMIQRALSVSRFLFLQSTLLYSQAMYDLEKLSRTCFSDDGTASYPCKENYLEELQHVEEEAAKRKFYAIGEIGIDLYWDKTYLLEQQIAFRKQIQLAKQYKLPVIHCREAFDEVFEILEEEKSPDLFGIFHCFTGTQALQSISYNMKLGIGGVVTFKNGKIDQF
jgi:TatD DNase family protein